MIVLFAVIGVILAGMMISVLYKKIDFVKLLILAPSVFICLYVIASGIFIWMESFTIPAALIAVCITEALILAAAFFVNGFFLPYITWNFVSYIPLLVLLAGAAVISNLQSAGFYGTGQDQGIYQIRAMYFMGEQYDNILDFPEYYEIEHKYEKNHYKEEVEDLNGYYFLSDFEDGKYKMKDASVGDTKEDAGSEENTSGRHELAGVLHGISTFPALLALWGRLFGLTNMPGVMTFLYLLTIANTWLICSNQKFKTVTAVIVTGLLTVCPIVLWSSQNTLTEMGLAMFISCFYELVSENNRKHLALLSAVPFTAACFFHVTMAVLMPLVIVVYLVNFIQTRDKRYMGALGISVMGYALGFTMMMQTAWYYTVSNLYQLFGKTKFLLNEYNILGFVWIMASLVFVFAMVFMLKPVSGRLLRKWKYDRKKEKGRKTAARIMILMAAVTLLVLALQMVLAVKQNMWIMKTGTFCFLLTTGYLALPLAFASVFILRRQFAGKRNMTTIVFSFLYIMLLYCGLVVTSVYYYYYYARYYVPFVMLLLVSAGFLIDRISWKIAAPAAAVCAGVVVWQSQLLYQQKDLTYGDYQILDNIASCVDEDDCILIYEQGYHIQRLFAMQLKGLTGVTIQYADMTRLGKQIEEYGSLYDNVFVLTYDIGTFQADPEEWRYVYRGEMETSLYDKFVENGMPYAREAVTMTSPVALLIWQE